jgi:hypothetical protein
MRMPYACTRKTASEDGIDMPVAAEPQLTGHISSRAPCIRMPMQP